MEIAFKASFMLAVAAEMVLVGVLVSQIWRRQRHGSTHPPVFTGGDTLTAAALFGGTMMLTALLTHGWSGLWSQDTLLYAATVGIVTAGLAAFVRRWDRGQPAHGCIVFLLPLGLGVLAGLAGV
ncbi:hypothetical protein [Streptomyces sp. A5-4]|uniref:hypothetical protein n=1 Tax=Streptomyces sp. A5-4 TaxID=3384771 RepID=UPI003DAA49E1